MRSAFKLKRKYNGSLTVETALVLPIFMLLAVALISILEMMNTYSKVEYALHETAREAAIMSYAVDKCLPVELLEENDLSAEIADFTLSETVIRALLIEKLSEDESATALIEGGNLGLRLWRSDVVNDENCIDIIVTYKVSPWINLFDIGSLTLVNRAKVHKWNGYSHTEEDDEYVYITAQGEVYHTNPNCPYLHVSIQSVNLSNIESYRNKDGSKYKPCKTCFDSSNGNIVYITEYGEAYHSSIDCGGIKRTVYRCFLEAAIYDGDAEAYNQLCYAYLEGDYVPEDYVKALDFFKKGYIKGRNLKALFNILNKETEIAKSKRGREALKQCFQFLIENGEKDIFILLAYEYDSGLIFEKSMDKKKECLQKAIDNHINMGHEIYGEMYFKGDGVGQDYKKSYEHFTCFEGYESFIKPYYLAKMYQNGLYVNKDMQKAKDLFRMIVESEISMKTMDKYYLLTCEELEK